MQRTSHSDKQLFQSSRASVDDFIRASLEKQFASFRHAPSNGGLHTFFMNLMEKNLISIALEQTAGNQSKAAGLLGMNRNTLRRKIEEHNIELKKKGSKNQAMAS